MLQGSIVTGIPGQAANNYQPSSTTVKYAACRNFKFEIGQFLITVLADTGVHIT